MALYFCKNADGTGVVDELTNPIQTKHTSDGKDVTIPIYIFNDGKRKGVPTDTAGEVPLIYTNIQVRIEGVQHTLQQAIPPSLGTVNLEFESLEGWNIGTIIKHGTERMRVEQITGANKIVVQRNYTLGGSSVIEGHNSESVFVAETKSVSLALPSPNDPSYEASGSFLEGGATLDVGFDPTLLTQAIDSREDSRLIKSSSGAKYHVGSLIKIDKEIMRIDSISNNDLTVQRGFNGTERANHIQNSVIYCVGLVDVLVGEDTSRTHKLFLRNSPPAKLPTQKKKDIKLVLVADEEPI